MYETQLSIRDEIIKRRFITKENRRKLRQPRARPKSHTFRNVLILLVVAIALLVIVIFPQSLVALVVLTALFLLGTFSVYYKRKLDIPIGGIELVTFSIVVATLAYGPIVGFVFGLITSTAAEILSRNIGPTTWIYSVTSGIAAVIVANIQAPFFILGMIATAFVLLFNYVPLIVIGNEDIRSMAIFYVVTNVAFNLVIFGFFSDILQPLLF